MREWWLIYSAEPGKNVPAPVRVAFGDLSPPDYGGFIDTANAGRHTGRDLLSTWIRDPDSENNDLTMYWGKKPPTDPRLGGGNVGRAAWTLHLIGEGRLVALSDSRDRRPERLLS